MGVQVWSAGVLEGEVLVMKMFKGLMIGLPFGLLLWIVFFGSLYILMR